jgi:hypothetical protein
MTTILRDRLTPFGEQFAAALAALPEEPGVRLRVLAAVDAIEPMRQILRRLGLEEKKRVIYQDGPLGISWYEDPTLYIQQWINSESVIVLKEDAEGAIELRFVMRLATDTVKTVYRLGTGAPTPRILRAAWDLGIRRITSEFHHDRAPASWPRQGTRVGQHGTQTTSTARDDGWIEQVMTLTRRP